LSLLVAAEVVEATTHLRLDGAVVAVVVLLRTSPTQRVLERQSL
jgi:hypothetical protein